MLKAVVVLVIVVLVGCQKHRITFTPPPNGPTGSPTRVPCGGSIHCIFYASTITVNGGTASCQVTLVDSKNADATNLTIGVGDFVAWVDKSTPPNHPVLITFAQKDQGTPFYNGAAWLVGTGAARSGPATDPGAPGDYKFPYDLVYNYSAGFSSGEVTCHRDPMIIVHKGP